MEEQITRLTFAHYFVKCLLIITYFIAGNATILYAAPPMVSNGPQPYPMPGYIPISPPMFPVMGPIPGPGSDGSLNTKFV